MTEKILMAAAQEINNRGIKFTIDQVAAQLGISKKTIYHYFPSKDVLITQVIKMVLADVESQEQEILADNDGDFAEKIKDLMLLAPQKYGKTNDWVMEEVRRFRPQDWKLIEQFKYDRMLVMSGFLENGIARGIIRKMNVQVAARLLLGACRELTEYTFLKDNNLDSVQARQFLTDVFLHGILYKK